ncbi:MAG: VIT1/CCC1 transporter family protein [Candidatus Woesearchaeota archaeon]
MSQYKKRAAEKVKAAKKAEPINIDKERAEARQAYHSEQHIKSGSNLRDFILGFNDGLVSIFSLLTGVAGANVSPKIVILAGFAGLSAGATSMGLNNYISYKSQIEFYKSEIEREENEIKRVPQREREEICEIYRKKGFKGTELERVVARICSNKKVWTKVMVEEELGLIEDKFDSPVRIAIITGLAFILGAMIPIAPYLFIRSASTGFMLSITFSIIFMFTVGAAKTVITKKSWLRSGAEMILVGAVSATAAFFIGRLFTL